MSIGRGSSGVAHRRLRRLLGLAVAIGIVAVSARAALGRSWAPRARHDLVSLDLGRTSWASGTSGTSGTSGNPVGPGVKGSAGPSKGTHRWVASMLLVLLVCAGTVVALAAPGTSRASQQRGSLQRRWHAEALRRAGPTPQERVISVAPASGATNVAPDTRIVVTFSEPIEPGSPDPLLRPAMRGSWLLDKSQMRFIPSVSFVPSTLYTVTIRGGPRGVRALDGQVLEKSVSWAFRIAPGGVLRLQQLLAKLGYLPLSFSGPEPPPARMALAQAGAFTWRDPGFPAAYTSLWSPTRFSALTRGALMAFEAQNGLAIDSTPGASVWAALLTDVVTGKRDAEPVSYVLVTKSLPEHLTVWVNGKLVFSDIPCNTGVAGAPTTDGTFEVYAHVEVSNMRGTDVTGTSYDVTVPWASYFNGGEALHGYPRTAYGFPQSNGCVEMPIATAGRVWPFTPIGTLVTVVGPTA